MQRKYDIDDVNEGIAYIAAFFTAIYHIPKISPFINILQGTLDFESSPIFKITIYYMNSLFWYLYGDLLFNDQMRYGFMFSGIVCLISICIYLLYEIRKYFIDALLNFVILIFFSWGTYRYFTLDFDDDVFLGRICIFTSLFLYCIDNIYNLYLVFKDKNFNLIQINYTIIHILSNLFWCIYGIIDKDHYIYVPYGIGIIIGVIEIIIFKKNKKRYPALIEKGFISTISTLGIENSGNEEEKKEVNIIKDNDNIKNLKESSVKKVKIIRGFKN